MENLQEIKKINEIRELNKSFVFRYACEHFGKKPTMRDILIYDLQNYWLSNYELQQVVKSSSADRCARLIRENGVEGYEWKQREKKIDGYNDCLEYHLSKLGVNGQRSLF